MLNLNTQKSNQPKAPLGESASKTRPIIPNTTPTTINKAAQVTDSDSFQDTECKKETQGAFHNHLDWLTLNFTGLVESNFQELIDRVGKGLITLEKGKAWSSGEKARNYQNTLSSPVGLKGAYNSYKSENGIDNHYDVTISLPGEYFTTLSTIEQWELLKYLYLNYSPTCTRTDVSIDDYSFTNIPIKQMIEAYKNDNYFDFKEYAKEEEYTSPDNCTNTHYFGAKGSKKLVRVYKHKNKSRRLETQFRGKYAQGAFETIATLERDEESDEEWSKIIQKTIGGIAEGAIDFRDRSKLKNPRKASKSKTKRLPFWQDFIDKIGAVHLIKKTTKSIDMSSDQATFNWFKKIAPKTIAIVFNLLGETRFIEYSEDMILLCQVCFSFVMVVCQLNCDYSFSKSNSPHVHNLFVMKSDFNCHIIDGIFPNSSTTGACIGRESNNSHHFKIRKRFFICSRVFSLNVLVN